MPKCIYGSIKGNFPFLKEDSAGWKMFGNTSRSLFSTEHQQQSEMVLHTKMNKYSFLLSRPTNAHTHTHIY